MPQATKRMAALGSVVALSTVDVYELASAIGSQFEKLIDCHGPESVTGLMPMVIRVLEHLEELAKLNEAEQTELVDLRFTVERLQTEKKLKAEERVKYEKVIYYINGVKLW
jgi:RILP-like protein 1